MSNKRGLLVLVCILIFISGCYNVDVTQTINADGSSFVSILVNSSELYKQVPDNTTSQIGQMSINTTSISPTNVDDPGCKEYENNTAFTCTEIDKGVIKLEGDFQVPLAEEESLQEIIYTYDATHIFEILDQANDNSAEESLKDSLSNLEMLGAELNYIVELPGEIAQTQVGEIFDNVVIIDLYDLESVSNAQIVSSVKKDLPWPIIGIIIGSALFIIILVIFILSIKTHKNHPTIDENELACKKYIEQYKKTYSADQLTQGLIASGHDPVKASEYVQKYY